MVRVGCTEYTHLLCCKISLARDMEDSELTVTILHSYRSAECNSKAGLISTSGGSTHVVPVFVETRSLSLASVLHCH